MSLDYNPFGFAELIGRHARQIPDKPAVSFNGETLSWAALDHAVEHLAHHLLSRGAAPNLPIAICMDRSINMIIAVAAVLRSGACYLPLDPNYPGDRIRFMLEDSAAEMILISGKVTAGLAGAAAAQIDVAALIAASGNQPKPAISVESSGEHLAYIIYTSGSTGQPKGVALPRRALRNLIDWQEQKAIQGGGKTLQFASLSFDVSFQEIFSTWHSGSELVLISEEDRKDPQQLLEVLQQEEIERLFLPFSVLHNFADFCLLENQLPARLRHVITAGEQLRITDAIRWFFKKHPDCRLHNHYGPSETHVITALTLPKNPSRWPALPGIGKAIPNCEVLILDDQLTAGQTGSVRRTFSGRYRFGRRLLAQAGTDGRAIYPAPAAGRRTSIPLRRYRQTVKKRANQIPGTQGRSGKDTRTSRRAR